MDRSGTGSPSTPVKTATVTDFESFRQWCRSPDYPDRGEREGNLWVSDEQHRKT